jgi:hypothetical protein
MPAFCTAIMILFIGFSQAGGFGSDIALLGDGSADALN